MEHKNHYETQRKKQISSRHLQKVIDEASAKRCIYYVPITLSQLYIQGPLDVTENLLGYCLNWNVHYPQYFSTIKNTTWSHNRISLSSFSLSKTILIFVQAHTPPLKHYFLKFSSNMKDYVGFDTVISHLLLYILKNKIRKKEKRQERGIYIDKFL